MKIGMKLSMDTTNLDSCLMYDFCNILKKRIAQTINADIELGQFDSTLARYSNRRSQALKIASRQPNLLDILRETSPMLLPKLIFVFYDFCSRD